MDKQSIFGLVLIFAIIVGSSYLMRPSDEELKREQDFQDSIAAVEQTTAGLKTPTTANTTQTASATDLSSLQEKQATQSASAKQEFYSLENEHLKIQFSNYGAKIYGAEIKGVFKFDKTPLYFLKDGQNNFGLNIPFNGKVVNTNQVLFNLNASASNGQQVQFDLINNQGERLLSVLYSLKKEAYRIQEKIEFSDKLKQSIGNQAKLLWTTTLNQQEKDIKNERRSSTVYYMYENEKWDFLKEVGDAQEELKDSPIKWIAYKQQFFNITVMPEKFFSDADVSVSTPKTHDFVKEYASKITAPLNDNKLNLDWVIAPNKYDILEAQGHDLFRIIKAGYWILKYINYVVLQVFEFFHKMDLNMGLVIILLTILLKLVVFPLTYKSYLSMAKMRVLKPEMDEIKEKVGKDNQQLLQQEYLKLYQKAGVNPLGGCIPMLLQMPLIMSFFFFFPNLFELRQESFLWIHDLSTYDAVLTFPAIPVIGISHLSLMCLLFTISQFFYTYFNSQMTASSASGAMAKQMKVISYVMPAIFFGVLNSYSAGLTFYYLCANLLTFAQQFIIKSRIDEDKIHAKIQENKKKNKNKKGGFQSKMESYMNKKKQDMENKRQQLNKNNKKK